MTKDDGNFVAVSLVNFVHNGFAARAVRTLKVTVFKDHDFCIGIAEYRFVASQGRHRRAGFFEFPNNVGVFDEFLDVALALRNFRAISQVSFDFVFANFAHFTGHGIFETFFKVIFFHEGVHFFVRYRASSADGLKQSVDVRHAFFLHFFVEESFDQSALGAFFVHLNDFFGKLLHASRNVAFDVFGFNLATFVSKNGLLVSKRIYNFGSGATAATFFARPL